MRQQETEIEDAGLIYPQRGRLRLGLREILLMMTIITKEAQGCLDGLWDKRDSGN